VKGKRNKAAFRQISERNKNLTERIDAGVTKNLRNAQAGAAPLPIYRFDGVAARNKLRSGGAEGLEKERGVSSFVRLFIGIHRLIPTTLPRGLLLKSRH
jgi:hypothetical protein